MARTARLSQGARPNPFFPMPLMAPSAHARHQVAGRPSLARQGSPLGGMLVAVGAADMAAAVAEAEDVAGEDGVEKARSLQIEGGT